MTETGKGALASMHVYITDEEREACLPGAGPLGWGAQCGAQKHSLLLRKPLTIIILQFVGSPPEVMGLDYIVSPPLLHYLILVLLSALSCRSFSGRFQSFHK